MKRRVKVVNLMMIAALIVALAPAGMYIQNNTPIRINIYLGSLLFFESA